MSLGAVLGLAAVAALVVGGIGAAAIVVALRGCDGQDRAPVLVSSPEASPQPLLGSDAPPAALPAPSLEVPGATVPAPAGDALAAETTAPIASAPSVPAVATAGPDTGEPATERSAPSPASASPAPASSPPTKTPPLVTTPPPTKSNAAATPPGPRPAGEAFAEARDRWRARDFRGCIQSLRRAEKSPQVISLDIRCHDRAEGRTKACELARRCPDLRWCRRFVSRHCR